MRIEYFWLVMEQCESVGDIRVPAFRYEVLLSKQCTSFFAACLWDVQNLKGKEN